MIPRRTILLKSFLSYIYNLKDYSISAFGANDQIKQNTFLIYLVGIDARCICTMQMEANNKMVEAHLRLYSTFITDICSIGNGEIITSAHKTLVSLHNV